MIPQASWEGVTEKNNRCRYRAQNARNGCCVRGLRFVLQREKQRLPEFRQDAGWTAPLHATPKSWWSRPVHSDEYCRKRLCFAPAVRAAPAIIAPDSPRIISLPPAEPNGLQR